MYFLIADEEAMLMGQYTLVKLFVPLFSGSFLETQLSIQGILLMSYYHPSRIVISLFFFEALVL